ncbi:hypothetical protein CEXT_235631 [Caerostris extrusa]|uniref:Uncharacterized protein n=1 Tax=Caerostris extrusa TaxID=172846 RepID=A0AAV4P0M3_CAEEX|nr:hypothetical protein CEXT_235631 [Caerostris extrusa]
METRIQETLKLSSLLRPREGFYNCEFQLKGLVIIGERLYSSSYAALENTQESTILKFLLKSVGDLACFGDGWGLRAQGGRGWTKDLLSGDERSNLQGEKKSHLDMMMKETRHPEHCGGGSGQSKIDWSRIKETAEKNGESQ